MSPPNLFTTNTSGIQMTNDEMNIQTKTNLVSPAPFNAPETITSSASNKSHADMIVSKQNPSPQNEDRETPSGTNSKSIGRLNTNTPTQAANTKPSPKVMVL